jgi:6-phosphogluconolactonase/glucosamine-6-phosphate isomerase/deaminase
MEILPAEDWASAVADALLDRLTAQPRLRLCLPTGDTPSPVYTRLGELDRAGRPGAWTQATVVLLDEWVGLPPGDPARCDHRIQSELLDRLAPAPRFVPIEVDGDDPDAAATRHDEAARDLDLAVLGLGMNGHVGFNEPGSRPEDGTRLVRLAVSSREAATARYGAAATPTAGITIGLNRLLEAREVFLLVTGERKAGILRRALREPEGPDCPAAYLRRHPHLTVFADEAAAAQL